MLPAFAGVRRGRKNAPIPGQGRRRSQRIRGTTLLDRSDHSLTGKITTIRSAPGNGGSRDRLLRVHRSMLPDEFGSWSTPRTTRRLSPATEPTTSDHRQHPVGVRTIPTRNQPIRQSSDVDPEYSDEDWQAQFHDTGPDAILERRGCCPQAIPPRRPARRFSADPASKQPGRVDTAGLSLNQGCDQRFLMGTQTSYLLPSGVSAFSFSSFERKLPGPSFRAYPSGI